MSSRRARSTAEQGPSQQGPRVLLLLCALGLVLIGVVMVYSASLVKALGSGAPATDFFTDQLVFAALRLRREPLSHLSFPQLSQQG